MHEYGLTRQIIDTASAYAKGEKIKTVALRIGGMSGVSGESVAMYFDIAAEGTPCEGAELIIEYVKPLLKCVDCGIFFERKPFSFMCACGGAGVPTETGREFLIKYIETENNE